MATYPMDFDVPHRGLKWLEWYGPHNANHPGVDLNKGVGNEDLGNDVVTPVDGIVVYVSPEPTQWNNNNGGFGWHLVVHHPAQDRWSHFAHCDDIVVAEGDVVQEGQLVAHVGNTGTTYAHLHWEVWLPAMYALQKAHSKPYRFYPSGWTRSKVQDHYEDPLAWVDQLNQQPQWKQDVEGWASTVLNDVQGFKAAVGPGAHHVLELVRKATTNQQNNND